MSSSETLNNFSEKVWEPLNIFMCPATMSHAVIILNKDITLSKSILIHLWQKARVKVTVDGGTDHWFRMIYQETKCSIENVNDMYLPHIIIGDFDSILPDTLEKARNRGLNVIETCDQNETDYTKTLRWLKQHCSINNIQLDYIYVICDTSGRFDHIMANINTLYKCESFFENVKIIQISSDSLTWLLSIGKHKIQIPDLLVSKECWCGLIPFGSSDNCISTTGLKWNLDKQCLKFGKLVSTSNTYIQKEVTIDTNVFIIWTMGIEPLIKKYKITISK